VRALVTEVVRRQLCEVAELYTELERGPRPGSANLRLALDEAAGGAWSAPEARAGRLLRRSRYPDFKRNATVRLRDGTALTVDFLWPSLRAVLEVDSVEFHGDPGDADDTDERHTLLEGSGFRVAHRRPFVINHAPARFVAGIEAWLDGLSADAA